MGNEGAVITRVTKDGFESFKRQMNDPKVRIISIPTVMPEKFMDDEVVIQRDQELYIKQDNVFGFYVTPIDAVAELELYKKEKEEAKKEEEAAKKAQEEKLAAELAEKKKKEEEAAKERKSSAFGGIINRFADKDNAAKINADTTLTPSQKFQALLADSMTKSAE